MVRVHRDPPAEPRAAEPGGVLTALAAELEQTVQTLWTWSPRRWTPVRVAAARAVIQEYARLARAHGQGPPFPMAVPDVEPHGLADQLAVLGRDVLRTGSAEAAAQARPHLATIME